MADKEPKARIRIGNYLDDLFIVLGCWMILIGVYVVCPVATLFVGGAMLICAGIIIGLGNRRPE